MAGPFTRGQRVEVFPFTQIAGTIEQNAAAFFTETGADP
jgi:hypothetical protein